MRKIYNYVLLYFREEIKWAYFIAVLVFAAICITLQYNFKLSNFYVEHHRRELSYFPRAFLLYAIPFVGTLFLYSSFYKKWDVWRNTSFVILVIFTLSVYALRCGTTFHTDLVNNSVDPLYKSYWLKVWNQLVYGFILFFFPFMWWWLVDRKKTSLYGFTYKGISFRPYFIILLLLVPLVAIASTQKDFLQAYPRFANSFKVVNGPIWGYGSLFEFAYAFDFAMNEFFFRGFVILAFARFLGRGIILPMAMFYVFIHFGKPLGETISSLFGGLALGIIAYETRSIYGGIIIHVGIAWMMEVGAGVGRFFGQ
jgi:hypothetical protein